MTNAQASMLVGANLRESMTLYSLAASEGHVRDYAGVTVVSCGMDLPFFNSAVLTGPVEDADGFDRILNLARAHFGTRRLPWSLWLCPDLLHTPVLEQVPRCCGRRHLRHVDGPAAMYLEALGPPAQELPYIELRPVLDPGSALDFCDISSEVFQLPIQTTRRIYGVVAHWSERIRGYVGYFEGLPICTAMAVIHGGTVGFYSVATRARWRRRGFAEALMRRILLEIRQETGIERSVLQSTVEGLPLYRKLGYREVSRFQIYVSD